MSQDNMNIYKTARMSTGLSQEAAAEVLGVSVESIRAYETGQRVPTDLTVAVMARRYMTPWLTLEHARATDELGIIPRGASKRQFALVAIQLYNYMIDFAEQHHGQQLLRIAEDGVIDEVERPILDEIVCKLEGISAAWLSIRCCEGIKKERPDVGASKRSRSAGKPENHSTVIISGFPAERNSYFGEGVTSL